MQSTHHHHKNNIRQRKDRPVPRHPIQPCRGADPAAPAPADAPQRPISDLLTPDAVAGRLGVSTKVLERWRGSGEGPAFVRLSRKTIRYEAAAVDVFIKSRVRNSTALG